MPPTSRELRPSTLFGTQKSYAAVIFMGRIFVPLEQAATRMLIDSDEGLDVPDFGYDKMQRRIYGVFIHFIIIYFLECETKREKTKLQCGQSKTKGCENAHWAMTPTMSDDMMRRVLTKIDNQEQLSPKKVGYVQSRLNLSSPTKNEFLALTSHVDKREFITTRIEPKDHHSSFNRTYYELQLSATLEGSVAANDFDQAIEKDIRPLEDASCAKISAKESNPTDEIISFFNSSQTILELAITNLQKRVAQLKLFYQLEADLDSFENNYLATGDTCELDLYIKNVANFLKQKELITTKLKYCANFKGANRFNPITSRKDFLWLKGFASTVSKCTEFGDQFFAFEQHMMRIKKEAPLTQFPALEKAEAMLAEAENQLAGLTDIGECNLPKLPLYLFGIFEGGIRRLPTQQEMLAQILEMTRKEPQKPKKRTPSPTGAQNTAPVGRRLDFESLPLKGTAENPNKHKAQREAPNPPPKKKLKPAEGAPRA